MDLSTALLINSIKMLPLKNKDISCDSEHMNMRNAITRKMNTLDRQRKLFQANVVTQPCKLGAHTGKEGSQNVHSLKGQAKTYKRF